MGRVRPANVAGFVAVVGLALAAHYGDQYQVLLVLVASVPVTFFLTLVRPRREHASWAMAVVLFGIVWIGLAMAHAVLLRELAARRQPRRRGADRDVHRRHGGLLRRPRLRPDPARTGDLAEQDARGAARAASSAARSRSGSSLVGYHDWIAGTDALVIGGAVALVAPIGDLFESLIKRDLEVKDTGRLFGAHGGALDRLDAVMFTIVTAYYVSVAVI